MDMAKSRVVNFYSDQTTFMTKRFGRKEREESHHLFSVMTLPGYQDGAGAQAGVDLPGSAACRRSSVSFLNKS